MRAKIHELERGEIRIVLSTDNEEDRRILKDIGQLRPVIVSTRGGNSGSGPEVLTGVSFEPIYEPTGNQTRVSKRLNAHFNLATGDVTVYGDGGFTTIRYVDLPEFSIELKEWIDGYKRLKKRAKRR